MILQLVQSLVDRGETRDNAAGLVLSADPFDLMLRMEQVWDAANITQVSLARQNLWSTGDFSNLPVAGSLPWDHLGYAYVLENTRAVQILRRVVREYRAGEALGIPSPGTQRWLNATEALLFGAANPLSTWLSTSSIRDDPEAVRRNAYWRLFGLDLAFGDEGNGSPKYVKANAANTGFVTLFEELLFELWQAMSNERNTSGANSSDDDRIYRIAEQLRYELGTRRKSDMLLREELAAATALGWADLTVSIDSPLIVDLRAQATSAGDRLRLIGDRVGLPAHSQSASFFAMAADLSIFLRAIEAGIVSGPDYAWALYLSQPPQGAGANPPKPIGSESRRVITEWAAATGKDLKARGKPVDSNRPRLVAVR